jgi:hypothetical protein
MELETLEKVAILANATLGMVVYVVVDTRATQPDIG